MTKITEYSCRVCIKNDGTVSIFEKLELEDERISDILMECANLTIVKNDGYLETICDRCIENLLRAHNFRKECIRSDQKIKQFCAVFGKIISNNFLNEDLKIEGLEYDDFGILEITNEETSEICIKEDMNILSKFNKTEHDFDQPKNNENKKSDKSNITHMNEHDYTSLPHINEEFEYEGIEILDEIKDEEDDNFKDFFNEQEVVTTNSNKILNLLVEKVNETIIDNASETVEKKIFNCNTCSKSFIDEKLLISHRKLHLERNYKCNICMKSFLQDGNLKRHLSLMHNLKCSKCGLTFDDKIKFDQHYKTHSNNILQCDVCMKSFQTQKLVQQHYKTSHEKVVNYICEVCGRSYNQHSKLEHHRKVVHLGIKPFKCHVCTKAYAYKDLLLAHVNNHFNVKAYKCTYCGKMFSSYSNLSSHIKYHTGNMKYKCSFCNKMVPTPAQLRVHLRIHTGEMPYECKDCGKKYNHISGYKIHLRVHTGERPFKCSSCDKGFRDTKSRSRHELVHTDERPFPCTLCNYKCKHPSNLKSHMKVHLKEKNLKI